MEYTSSIHGCPDFLCVFRQQLGFHSCIAGGVEVDEVETDESFFASDGPVCGRLELLVPVVSLAGWCGRRGMAVEMCRVLRSVSMRLRSCERDSRYHVACIAHSL